MVVYALLVIQDAQYVLMALLTLVHHVLQASYFKALLVLIHVLHKGSRILLPRPVIAVSVHVPNVKMQHHVLHAQQIQFFKVDNVKLLVIQEAMLIVLTPVRHALLDVSPAHRQQFVVHVLMDLNLVVHYVLQDVLTDTI
jgi:hypothetical protein